VRRAGNSVRLRGALLDRERPLFKSTARALHDFRALDHEPEHSSLLSIHRF